MARHRRRRAVAFGWDVTFRNRPARASDRLRVHARLQMLGPALAARGHSATLWQEGRAKKACSLNCSPGDSPIKALERLSHRMHSIRLRRCKSRASSSGKTGPESRKLVVAASIRETSHAVHIRFVLG